MDVKEFAALGGKARWKGISDKKRKSIMLELTKKRVNKRQKALSTGVSKKA